MTLQLKIHINPEYEKLVPEIPEQEFAAIKADINEKGQLVPITVNDQGIILDGHHRYRACQELGIECEFVEKNFNNGLLEKLFIIDANLKRRHLNSFQRIELALKEKPILEEIARLNSEANLKQNYIKNYYYSKAPSVRNLTVGRVDDQIGKKSGSSRDTVRKVQTLLERAPEGLKEKLEIGKITINKAFKNLLNEERRQEIITKARSIAITTNSNERFLLINNDFRQVKRMRGNSIDLIFTDPPYGKKYLPIYQDLAKLASKTLVENGSLITYVGHYAIPEIIQYMKAAGLDYYWMLAVKLGARFPRHHPRRIVIKYKPLLWFVKRRGRDRKTVAIDYISDFIESKTPDKNFHDWAQSQIEAHHVISRLTVENQIVLDPMMGSGTTGSAALQLKRKFIGIEINPQTFEIAKANLDNVRQAY
jgi:ParB-like chromosome segregation protein Spo0J